MHDTRRLPLTLAFGLLLLGLLATYRDSFASLFNVWATNSTFSHGVLILPISAWLAWRKRDELARASFESSAIGVVLLAGLAALWVVARGAGVLGFEHFVIVAMIPALVLAVLGWDVARVLMFPLAYLIFAVPIGHAIVPMLMQATADVATWVLKATAIPVHRSNMYISIPEGRFEVARACSGLNYVVTGLALGALYSYLTYATWCKRLLSMAAFIVIPVVANGMRVYFTILTSHFTNMRFGPGEEHVWFGRVFFIAVMLAMFWIGRRWHDDALPAPVRATVLLRPTRSPVLRWSLVAGALAVIVAAPFYLAVATDRIELALQREVDRLQLPAAPPGWSGPEKDAGAWRPLYAGARVERSGAYRDPRGARVDVFVGVYGIGTTGGSEMISYGNRIFPDERVIVLPDGLREVVLPNGRQLSVREQSVRDDSGEHLVWYWFMVGGRSFTDPYTVKAHEALAFLVRDAVTERVITLSTPVDGDDRSRLEQYVTAHAACVAAGFAFEGCGP